MKTKILGLLAVGLLAGPMSGALAQSKENKTLLEAKAYTDEKVGTEATQRTQVDDGLQGQIDGLQEQVNALTQGPPSTIVITQSPSDFERFGGLASPTILASGGHILGATADGGIIMGLAAPVSVGGVAYRLSAVEYCLARDTTEGGIVTNAVVYHDSPGAPNSPLAMAVIDATDRTAAGCYTLQVPALNNPRGYSLALGLTGQTTNLTTTGVLLSGVRTTWVVQTP